MKLFSLKSLVIVSLVYPTIYCSEPFDPALLLRNNEVEQLNQKLNDVQQKFEAGNLTEIELRNTYRPFYELNSVEAKNLKNWVSNAPDSYPAHLALGIYQKKMGTSARGTKFTSETPPEDIQEMRDYFYDSSSNLTASLKLTDKPYLSVFHLLTISLHQGGESQSRNIFLEAERILPNNSLVRNRYFISLLPRWGGSHSEADKFIMEQIDMGYPDKVVLQLKAIKQEDIARILKRQKKYAEARDYFEEALAIGSRVGGTFSTDWLLTAIRNLCEHEPRSRNCP